VVFSLDLTLPDPVDDHAEISPACMCVGGKSWSAAPAPDTNSTCLMKVPNTSDIFAKHVYMYSHTTLVTLYPPIQCLLQTLRHHGKCFAQTSLSRAPVNHCKRQAPTPVRQSFPFDVQPIETPSLKARRSARADTGGLSVAMYKYRRSVRYGKVAFTTIYHSTTEHWHD